MSLKRSGVYRQMWLGVLSALAFLGYETIVLTHLATFGNWAILFDSAIIFGFASLFFVILIGFVANLFAIVLLFASLWYARVLSGIHTNVEGNAPLATFQPDASLALQDGETLTLSLRRRLGQGENVFGGAIALLLHKNP